jgi:hypothetical protein
MYFDTVVTSRAHEDWLARNPFQSCDGTIVSASYNVKQAPFMVEIPKGDMTCR